MCARLGTDLKPAELDTIGHDAALAELDGVLDAILAGQLTGRAVVDVQR